MKKMKLCVMATTGSKNIYIEQNFRSDEEPKEKEIEELVLNLIKKEIDKNKIKINKEIEYQYGVVKI